MGNIDLHTHTTASDGSMTPSELVKHAQAKGLSAIAITDHDTINGLEEAVGEADKLGFEVIPGLEISVDFKPEMHILGYFVHADYRRIEPVLQELLVKRNERNPKIVRSLNALGFDITMEEVAAKAAGGVVGRPHIAKVLVDKGYAESTAEAFEKFLAAGRPAYFRKEKLTPEEGIAEILKAGGIPVLAHPIYLGLDEGQLDRLLEQLKDAGLKGIEAYYVDHTKEQTVAFIGLAGKHGLLVTGGSDFHGSFKPDIELGTGRGDLRIPYELLERMKVSDKART